MNKADHQPKYMLYCHQNVQVNTAIYSCAIESWIAYDPDGHIVELATAGPGFAVDEAVADLGKNLKLPAWWEQSRPVIEQSLRPITTPEWHLQEARS